ncbi:hypothetical protein, partial [Brevibacterium ammoniilyticum]
MSSAVELADSPSRDLEDGSDIGDAEMARAEIANDLPGQPRSLDLEIWAVSSFVDDLFVDQAAIA